MKKITKCIALVMTAVILALSVPNTSYAANDCVCVRDYGAHMYNHRVYSRQIVVEVLQYYYVGNQLYVKMGIGEYVRGECVCGKPGASWFVTHTWDEPVVGPNIS